MEDEKKLKAEDEEKNTKAGVPADSFKGLLMDELISAPLIAVNEAQQQLAASSLDFYNKIAFEDDAKTRCLEFDLDCPVQVPDGIGKKEGHVKVPFLGLVPIHSLLIDDVDVNFQMEVTHPSTSKSADLGTDVTPKCFGWEVCKVR